jgi:uncharacterized protein involved in type VI secretion and phage assembly
MAYDYDKASSEFKIFSGGSQISKTAQQTISRVSVDASIFLPRTCEIEFTEAPNNIGKYTYSLLNPGADVAVFAYAAGNMTGELLFKGKITGMEMLSDEGSGTRTVFRCSDVASDMIAATKTRLFKEMTVSEVIKKVAAEYSLNPFSLTSTSRITSTSNKHDAIVQLNESDWDFVCRLARELGYVAFVHPFTELTRSKARLSWGPPPNASSGPGSSSSKKGFELGDGRILSLRAMVSGMGLPSSALVAGWDHKQERGSVGSSSLSGKPSDGTDIKGSPSKFRSSKSGKRTLVERMASTTAEANAMAKGYAKRLASSAIDVELIVRGHPAARLNEAIYLDDALTLEGNFVATAVTHQFGGEDGFITTIYCTGIEDRTLAGLQGEIPGRTKLNGVYPAIVNSVEDPQKKGRVNLTLPWLDSTYITGWAQVLQMGAGKGVGWQAIPAPKDEVLVAFENGQIETPYVIGGLFASTTGKVPTAQLIKDGSPVKQVFTTKTGHQLIFDDEGDDSGITIRTKGGETCSIVMSDKKGITITTKGEGGVIINSDADIAVTTKKNAKVTANEVAVTSKGAIKVNGKGTLDVTASNINLNASGSAKIKGARVTVESSGPLTLKGAVVKLN